MAESTERLSVALADRYQIETGVGACGTATVYLAEDVKHDRKVVGNSARVGWRPSTSARI